jgi:hypothetical protein
MRAGALTLQRFKDDEQARMDAQIDMRDRCVDYVERVAAIMLTERDTAPFWPLFSKVAAELKTVEPR